MGKTFDFDEYIASEKVQHQIAAAIKVDPKIRENLEQIYVDYIKIQNTYRTKIEKIVSLILQAELPEVLSVASRVKSVESLLGKVLKNKASLTADVGKGGEKEKYRNLDCSNYYKIINDLGGIKILVRYRHQWKDVHNYLWEKYYKGEEHYITNETVLSNFRENEKPFLAERPKAYLRHGTDLSPYQSVGKQVFNIEITERGYNSNHYIINDGGRYIEIQVRTIYDEAWSECTHDLVYKSGIDDIVRKEELKTLSKCLATQTLAAEEICNHMYEKVFGPLSWGQASNTEKLEELQAELDKNGINPSKVHMMSDVDSILEVPKEEFDGNISNLLIRKNSKE